MIIVVSGGARTGTSLMMQMLVAGGMEAVYDEEVKPPNVDNPKGYFEFGNLGAWLTTDAMNVIDWDHCEDKVIKITWPWIQYLPVYRSYRIIYMLRDPMCILRSRRAVSTWPRDTVLTDEQVRRFCEDYHMTTWAAFHNVLFRSRTACCPVQYETLFRKPKEVCKQIANDLLPEFRLKTSKMLKAIDSDLYHNKSSDNEHLVWKRMFEKEKKDA